MTQFTTARSFTLPHSGLVFDDALTGERAEVLPDGTARYRANSSSAEEAVTVTRGRALAWLLRIRECEDTHGFMVGILGATLNKEADLGDWGLFALPKTASEPAFALAAD